MQTESTNPSKGNGDAKQHTKPLKKSNNQGNANPEPLGWRPEILAELPVMVKSAIEKDAEQIVLEGPWKGLSQLAVDLNIIELIDLTTLAGDDTSGRVRRLCAKAKKPVPSEIMEKLGLSHLDHTVGAVCVYHQQIKEALGHLERPEELYQIPVAAVSTAFPHGQNASLEDRCAQIRASVKAGASEIDVVIRRELALNKRWQELYEELVAMREACGDAHIKVILGVGDLKDYDVIAWATCVAIMSGAYCVKTSTGMEKSFNATYPVGLIMMRMIRWFYTEVDPGRMIMLKPAGGIGTAKIARGWYTLMLEELGRLDRRWITRELFRIGASSLLDDLVAQITMNTLDPQSRTLYTDKTEIPMG